MTGTEKIYTFRVEVGSDAFSKELRSIISASGGFRYLGPESSENCDLLIYEISEQQEKGFRHIETVQQSGQAMEIFLTSRQLSPELLIAAMRSGIKEFIPQPVNMEDILKAVSKFKERSAARAVSQGAALSGPAGKMYYVIGSKGGVGTTTVAVNLATSLIEMEGVNSVLLADMSPTFGDLPVFMGMEPPVFSWLEIIKNISRVDALYLMSILYKHPSGLHVLPAPSVPYDGQVSAETIDTLFRLLRSIFDYIVVDSGRIFDSASRTVMKFADKVLVVSNLSLPCIINVKRLGAAVQKFGIPDNGIEIIANRYQKNSRISIEDAQETLNKKIQWTVPNDFAITINAINQGKPITSLAYNSSISRSLRSIAAQLTGRGEKKKEKSGLFGLR